MICRSVDVLVVGLGPAGARAATAAAQSGASVFAIDRKRQVGLPVQCAEFLPCPAGKFAQTPGVLAQSVQGMCTALPSGARHRDAFPGLMIHRAAFDQALADQAQYAGAQLALSSQLMDIDVGASCAYVKQDAQIVQISYTILIAADGPHSRVGSLLGLTPLETLLTRQYTVRLLAAYEDSDIWLSSAYSGGYAWLFPKATQANIGVGVRRRFSTQLKDALDHLHHHLQTSGRVGTEILARTGGLIPVGGLRDPVRVQHILFAGDAAGLTHPITGAGISAALDSGEYAGLAAAQFCATGQHGALTSFEETMRDHFAAYLTYACKQRARLLNALGAGTSDQDEVFRNAWIAFDEYHAARHRAPSGRECQNEITLC